MDKDLKKFSCLRKSRGHTSEDMAPFLHVKTTLLASPTAPGLLSLYPFPWAGGCRPCVCENYLSTIRTIIKTYSADRVLMTTHMCAGALLGLLLDALL